MPAQLLSAYDLAVLQNELTYTLDKTCSISRNTSLTTLTRDDAGAILSTWTSLYAGTACRLTVYQGRKGGVERAVMERYETVLWWRIDLPVGTDVTAKDRIVVGARTFEVLSVGGPTSYAAELLCMCVELLSS